MRLGWGSNKKNTVKAGIPKRFGTHLCFTRSQVGIACSVTWHSGLLERICLACEVLVFCLFLLVTTIMVILYHRILLHGGNFESIMKKWCCEVTGNGLVHHRRFLGSMIHGSNIFLLMASSLFHVSEMQGFDSARVVVTGTCISFWVSLYTPLKIDMEPKHALLICKGESSLKTPWLCSMLIFHSV